VRRGIGAGGRGAGGNRGTGREYYSI